MNTLIKSPVMPAFRSLMEDFWNSENIFERSLFRKDSLPAVNIKETDGGFDVEVAAPGYQKKDFKIDIQNGVLHISAETSDEKSEENENYTRKEFSYSSFNRSFSLPENVKEENVTAKYEKGLLLLKLEKAAKAQPKAISVE
jgi:HSP20 family protein